jgi:hypothetical protein
MRLTIGETGAPILLLSTTIGPAGEDICRRRGLISASPQAHLPGVPPIADRPAHHRSAGKFSEQELSDLRSGDDLATRVAAKYGLAKDIAQRDVTTLLNGRAF